MACRYEEELFERGGVVTFYGCPTCPYKNLEDCKEFKRKETDNER